MLEIISAVERPIRGMETLNQRRCHLQLLLSSAVDRADCRLTHLVLLYPQTRQGINIQALQSGATPKVDSAVAIAASHVPL